MVAVRPPPRRRFSIAPFRDTCALGEGRFHFGRAGEALPRLLLQAAHHDRLQVGRHVGRDAPQRRHGLAAVGEQNVERRPTGERGAAALAGAAHLTRLTRLVLRDSSLGPDAEEALRERFGRRVWL